MHASAESASAIAATLDYSRNVYRILTKRIDTAE
jgi:hypothetical protein